MDVPPSPKVQDQEVGEFEDVSVNWMVCLQVWQAGANVKDATGAVDVPLTLSWYNTASPGASDSVSMTLLPERLMERGPPLTSSSVPMLEVVEIPSPAPSIVNWGDADEVVETF